MNTINVVLETDKKQSNAEEYDTTSKLVILNAIVKEQVEYLHQL